MISEISHHNNFYPAQVLQAALMEHQASMTRKTSWPKFLLLACAILSFFLQLTLAAGAMDKMDTTRPSQLINDQERIVSQNNSFGERDAMRQVYLCFLPDAGKNGWSFVEITPSGNITVHLGSTLTLSCNIVGSIPDLCYRWFFNDTRTNVTEKHLTINSISWDNKGMYRCCVHSPANNLTDCASTSVKITTDKEAILEISVKVIVGAVFVLVAGIALIATLVYYLCSYIKRKNSPNAIPSVYEDQPVGPQMGSLVNKETKPEISPDANTTYQVLQRGDEAIYQELEK